MGGSTFDTVLPPLSRFVNDRRRLTVGQLGGSPLSCKHLLQVGPVGDEDHVPIVKIGELHGIPLDVISRLFIVSADLVRIDGGLVPVNMDNGVFETSRTGRSEGLGNAPRRHTTFAFDDMDPRGLVSVVVFGTVSQSKRRGDTDTGSTGNVSVVAVLEPRFTGNRSATALT